MYVLNFLLNFLFLFAIEIRSEHHLILYLLPLSATPLQLKSFLLIASSTSVLRRALCRGGDKWLRLSSLCSSALPLAACNKWLGPRCEQIGWGAALLLQLEFLSLSGVIIACCVVDLGNCCVVCAVHPVLFLSLLASGHMFVARQILHLVLQLIGMLVPIKVISL
jgi:hypothetical protein